jgi:hypothetical protein
VHRLCFWVVASSGHGNVSRLASCTARANPALFAVVCKPEARQRLIDWLTDVVARYPLLEIDLFFDSSEAGDHTVNDRFRVRFSGGRGPGRADEAMVSHLQWQTQSGKTRPRFVVTADQPLARRASALGAAILEPAALSLVVSKGEMLA